MPRTSAYSCSRLCLQGRTAARHTINGLACAIGFVTLLAVLSRLHPQWFPVNDQIETFGPQAARKLSYPLNYWNALAAFAAIGVPLLLAVALAARSIVGQALAAAALPLSALCVYLTLSRGGTLALVVGVVVFLLFVPRRLEALGTVLVAGTASAILLSAASQRDALQDGLPTAAAISQGTELVWLAAIVCGGVALMQVAMALAARHLQRPKRLAPDRRATLMRSLALLAIVCAAAVATGIPGEASQRWQEFKAPAGVGATANEDNVFSRLQGTNGHGRYQYWQAALDANATRPWLGIGPGTFEFWWARHGTNPAFVRDAHTLYFETLAETGIVGFALLAGLLALLLGAAVVRSLTAPAAVRVWIAAAAGGLAAFVAAAAFEWVWEVGAIACVVMLLGAVVVRGRDETGAAADRPASPPWAMRLALAFVAVVAIVAVAVPMAGALATRDSRDAAADGRLRAALAASGTAERVQPYAATPDLQRALVLEAAADLANSAAAARAATGHEPTNWRTWFVLARVEARRGEAKAALVALRKARSLNPRSPLMAVR